jgi:molecular chaperone GrpE (heat shock protein)
MNDKTRGIILNDKPVSIIPVHPKMWDQVTEERIQYRDALENTKKNMMEMERDLYLKINLLEEQLESIRDRLADFREELKNSPDKVSFDKETLVKFILSLEVK